MGTLANAARKMCDDCGRNDRPLAWSRDGYTRICEPCRVSRGEREQGPPSALAVNNMAVEAAVAAGKLDEALDLLSQPPPHSSTEGKRE